MLSTDARRIADRLIEQHLDRAFWRLDAPPAVAEYDRDLRDALEESPGYLGREPRDDLDGVEYWGITDDGYRWRVQLVGEPCDDGDA